jgi:hypothetical protein
MSLIQGRGVLGINESSRARGDGGLHTAPVVWYNLIM